MVGGPLGESVVHDEQPTSHGKPDRDPTILVGAVRSVEKGDHSRVLEDCGCFLETNPMFGSICPCLLEVPFEVVLHPILPTIYFGQMPYGQGMLPQGCDDCNGLAAIR